MIFQRVWRNGARFNLPQKVPNSYAILRFCAWYVIVNLVSGYNINSTCIKKIKAMFQAKKSSKSTRLKGMGEFLQAELEADPTGAAGHGEKVAEESHQLGSRGVVKCTQSQSTEAGSSKKKTRREPVIEVLSRKTSVLAIDPESIHAGSKKDEYSEVPLFLRSRLTKGPTVITTEALPVKVTGRQASRGKPVSLSIEAVPSGSFQGQRMSVDPIDIHPSSSVEIMSSVEVLEQSSLSGLVGAELLTTGVLPTPVLSSSSSEKLDFSGDDNVDWDDVHSAPDTSKYSYLAEEKMQIATPRIELLFRETSIVESIPSSIIIITPFFSFVINIVLLK